MKNHNTLWTLLLLGAALLLVAAPAHAQFVGDVFFADPSIAVPEGGTAVFEVQVFTGIQVLGAAHFDVVYDPAQLEVVSVDAGTTPELAPGHVSVTTPGRVAVVDLNGESLTRPFGTSSLARIEVRPLVSAGTRVPLSIQVRSLLRPDSVTPVSGGRGFSGEVVVVSALQSSTSSPLQVRGAAKAGDGDRSDLEQRALELRRPGLAVDLYELETKGNGFTAVRHRVVVPDPAAPSEAPAP